jgi:hypothetical protein
MAALAVSVAFTAALSVGPFRSTFLSAPRLAFAPLLALKDANPAEADVLIDELLSTPNEALLARMGRQIDSILKAEFMQAIELRIAGANEVDESQALEQLRVSVVDFAEEVADGVQRLEPAYQKWTEEEETARSQASAAKDPSTPPRRRTATDVATAFVPQLPAAEGEGAKDIERSRGRFRLQQLLAAAHASADQLDARLVEMSEGNLLDAGFFSHIQWEVDEQIRKKNQKLLTILELVVQRACLQVEAGRPEVGLLTSLLQTRDKLIRAEMFERRLATASAATRTRFGHAVEETMLALEKAVLSGQTVDKDLLLQLRLIGIEMEPYVQAESRAE